MNDVTEMPDDKFDEDFAAAYKGMQKAIEDSANKQKRSVRVSVLSGLMPFAVLWGLGVVVSKGFWWTFSSLFIPFIGPGTAVYWMVEKFTGGQ